MSTQISSIASAASPLPTRPERRALYPAVAQSTGLMNERARGQARALRTSPVDAVELAPKRDRYWLPAAITRHRIDA